MATKICGRCASRGPEFENMFSVGIQFRGNRISGVQVSCRLLGGWVCVLRDAFLNLLTINYDVAGWKRNQCGRFSVIVISTFSPHAVSFFPRATSIMEQNLRFFENDTIVGHFIRSARATFT